MSLPPYAEWELVLERLQRVFPEGTPQRNYCVREIAASTAFVMLYIGAIEGASVWMAPKHVMRMTDAQAAKKSDMERQAYSVNAMRPGYGSAENTWYRDNSREPVRDETIRQGFMTNGAAIERPGLATTSGKPRYALKADFAALFDPALTGSALDTAIASWQEANLSAAARARVALMRRGAVTTGEGVLVNFPNGETRRMAAGPSSVITKAVIEEFAARFLVNPAVLWVSESGAKVIARDDELAKTLGLRIDADRVLPDIILVDLGAGTGRELVLVFIEVVATDGPMTAERRAALLKTATDAGFPAARIAFITAFLDRSQSAFKRAVPELAWASFAWFASEADHIVVLHDGAVSPAKIAALLPST